MTLLVCSLSYNFFFISSGKNPASTVHALQRPSDTAPDPRPRPTLQLLDRGGAIGFVESQQPQFANPTAADLALRRAPAPRPRNDEKISQRAESVRAESQRNSGKLEVDLLLVGQVESQEFRNYQHLLLLYRRVSGPTELKTLVYGPHQHR